MLADDCGKVKKDNHLRIVLRAGMLQFEASMRIAIAQIAPLLGNLEANLALHLDAGRRAARAGADLVLFPELSLTGYRLQDLVPDVARRLDDRGILKPLYALSRRIALAFGMVEE